MAATTKATASVAATAKATAAVATAATKATAAAKATTTAAATTAATPTGLVSGYETRAERSGRPHGPAGQKRRLPFLFLLP